MKKNNSELSKKNVGIMTMQRVINYGSFMQAYSLKTIVEELGYDVQFVDYNYEKSIVETKKNYFKKIKKNLNVFWFLKKKAKMHEFKVNYENYIKKYLNVQSSKNYNPKIDNLIIGSDEVFNCMQCYPVGYSRELYGKNYNCNKISYAASFGYTTLDKLECKGIKDEVGTLLNEFKSISIRDDNSFNIIKNITKKKPIKHLDPALLGDYDKLIEKYDVSLSDFIIVYAYTDRLTSNEEKTIKKFAKLNNKKIVSFGFPQRIADYNLVVDPFEMLAYFKKSDLIITDTFHGTIFSIVTNRDFYTLIRNENNNKLTSLLNRFGLQNRRINNISDLFDKKSDSINYEKVNNIIFEEKNCTIEYLKSNLE